MSRQIFALAWPSKSSLHKAHQVSGSLWNLDFLQENEILLWFLLQILFWLRKLDFSSIPQASHSVFHDFQPDDWITSTSLSSANRPRQPSWRVNSTKAVCVCTWTPPSPELSSLRASTWKADATWPSSWTLGLQNAIWPCARSHPSSPSQICVNESECK